MDIRTADRSDLRDIVAIYNDSVVNGYSNCDLSGMTEEGRAQWFEEHRGRFPIWVATDGGAVVGWTCLTPYEAKPCFDLTATFSTYVSAAAQGRGVGDLLRTHLIAAARQIGFKHIINRVFATNRQSIGLALKHGFKLVGCMPGIALRDGQSIDCLFFQYDL